MALTNKEKRLLKREVAAAIARGDTLLEKVNKYTKNSFKAQTIRRYYNALKG